MITHVSDWPFVGTAEIGEAPGAFRDRVADPARQSLSGGIPQRVEFKISRVTVVTGFKAVHPLFEQFQCDQPGNLGVTVAGGAGDRPPFGLKDLVAADFTRPPDHAVVIACFYVR